MKRRETKRKARGVIQLLSNKEAPSKELLSHSQAWQWTKCSEPRARFPNHRTKLLIAGWLCLVLHPFSSTLGHGDKKLQHLSCYTTHCPSTPWSIAVSLELKYSLLEGGEAPETWGRGKGRRQTNIPLGKAEKAWKSQGKVRQTENNHQGRRD